jgi:hypothetical protein
MKQPESLESFYPLLAKDIEVQEKLTSQFAGRAPSILQQMEAGSGLGGAADTVSDLLEELVKDECGEVATFYGRGSDGFFPITICTLGPVSFIRASEFDDIGYFGSTNDARSHAEDEYEPYGPFVDDPDAEDEEWEEESEND